MVGGLGWLGRGAVGGGFVVFVGHFFWVMGFGVLNGGFGSGDGLVGVCEDGRSGGGNRYNAIQVGNGGCDLTLAKERVNVDRGSSVLKFAAPAWRKVAVTFR